jgi:hypothetical protein
MDLLRNRGEIKQKTTTDNLLHERRNKATAVKKKSGWKKYKMKT